MANASCIKRLFFLAWAFEKVQGVGGAINI
jgi:hypothetical protein